LHPQLFVYLATRFRTLPVLAIVPKVMRLAARIEALESLIYLARTETEQENVSAAVGAVASFCEYSKAAVFALRDAAAPDQPNSKGLSRFRLSATQPAGIPNSLKRSPKD